MIHVIRSFCKICRPSGLLSCCSSFCIFNLDLLLLLLLRAILLCFHLFLFLLLRGSVCNCLLSVFSFALLVLDIARCLAHLTHQSCDNIAAARGRSADDESPHHDWIMTWKQLTCEESMMARFNHDRVNMRRTCSWTTLIFIWGSAQEWITFFFFFGVSSVAGVSADTSTGTVVVAASSITVSSAPCIEIIPLWSLYNASLWYVLRHSCTEHKNFSSTQKIIKNPQTLHDSHRQCQWDARHFLGEEMYGKMMTYDREYRQGNSSSDALFNTKVHQIMSWLRLYSLLRRNCFGLVQRWTDWSGWGRSVPCQQRSKPDRLLHASCTKEGTFIVPDVLDLIHKETLP